MLKVYAVKAELPLVNLPNIDAKSQRKYAKFLEK